MTSRKQHQEFSRRVADFAGYAEQIVRKYDGYLVYCGGDDVLALLPTNRALACSYALRQSFEQTLAPVMPEGAKATLSAGIAIVHAMDNLQVALEWAREAERLAKRTRDALAVARHPRSGGVNRYSAPWNRFSEWDTWIQAFRDGLADGFPYELRQLASEYRGLSANGEVLQREATRVLERKQKPAQTLEIPHWVVSAETLHEFSEMLLIARFIAGYIP
jgi:CRISPR-associated protein Cmr2